MMRGAMKDVGVNVRIKVGGDEGRVPPDDTAVDRGPVEGLRRVAGSGPEALTADGMAEPRPQAPDAQVDVSVAIRTDRRMPNAAELNGQLAVEIDATWQPNLDDRSDGGLTRFTPVSMPWAATFPEAVGAARDVKPLPNLSPSVREAERTFRHMVRKDPVKMAQAYLTQARANQHRLRARVQGSIKVELDKAVGRLPHHDAEKSAELVRAAEHALHQVPGMKPGNRMKLLDAFTASIQQTGDAKQARRAMLDAVHVPLKIETDEIKLMSPHFNGQRIRLGQSVYDGADAAKIGPAVFNTALHPTATALARIAVELALKETDGPVVVMAGGVAAGKGFAAQKANFDDRDAAVIFDPDGESSQTFLETIEALATEHGTEVRLVGVVTDPIAAWLRALGRSFEEGRTVSETAFSHSHSTGVENMIAGAQRMRARNKDVVLIDNNAWPKLYEGEPPPPMSMEATYGKITDITDSLDQTGRVPDWVREAFYDNDYMMKHVIDPLEAKMQDPDRLQERKAIFDSLKEDRRVFEYAHPRV